MRLLGFCRGARPGRCLAGRVASVGCAVAGVNTGAVADSSENRFPFPHFDVCSRETVGVVPGRQKPRRMPASLTAARQAAGDHLRGGRRTVRAAHAGHSPAACNWTHQGSVAMRSIRSSEAFVFVREGWVAARHFADGQVRRVVFGRNVTFPASDAVHAVVLGVQFAPVAAVLARGAFHSERAPQPEPASRRLRSGALCQVKSGGVLAVRCRRGLGG